MVLPHHQSSTIHPRNHMHIFQSKLISQHMLMHQICDFSFVERFVHFVVFQLLSKEEFGPI